MFTFNLNSATQANTVLDVIVTDVEILGGCVVNGRTLDVRTESALRKLFAKLVNLGTDSAREVAGKLWGAFPQKPKPDFKNPANHVVTLGYTTDDDGVHVECACGWGKCLGYSPSIKAAADAEKEHLDSVATNDIIIILEPTTI